MIEFERCSTLDHNTNRLAKNCARLDSLFASKSTTSCGCKMRAQRRAAPHRFNAAANRGMCAISIPTPRICNRCGLRAICFAFQNCRPANSLRCRGAAASPLSARAGRSLLESSALTRISRMHFLHSGRRQPSCNTTKTWYCSTPKKSPLLHRRRHLAAPRKLLPV